MRAVSRLCHAPGLPISEATPGQRIMVIVTGSGRARPARGQVDLVYSTPPPARSAVGAVFNIYEGFMNSFDRRQATTSGGTCQVNDAGCKQVCEGHYGGVIVEGPGGRCLAMHMPGDEG